MPVDWKSSHTRTLHLLTLNLSEKGVSDSLLFDTSDDEELREQLDMHSIIVSCVSDEPLFTADQVQRRYSATQGKETLELKNGFFL
uniref:Uncharacterized protein n=1 Tax=Colobus angolensis palliatus TaxID=336983 RepID=A0A2K5K027_COLAP